MPARQCNPAGSSSSAKMAQVPAAPMEPQKSGFTIGSKRLHLFRAPHLFRDHVYTLDRWKWHQSWKRYLPEGFTSFLVAWAILPPMLFFTIIAVMVCAYYTIRDRSGSPAQLFNWQLPFTLTSFVLSLLMVFKTNSSYARWYEARVVWGGLLNLSRNIVRDAHCWAPEGTDPAVLHIITNYTAALGRLLKIYIRQEQKSAPAQLAILGLTELDIRWLCGCSNPCTAASQVLTELIRRLGLHPQLQAKLDEQVMLYVNSVGACERILRQPIPLPYTRHTIRFMIAWLGFLPLTLWPLFKWWTPGIEALLSFLILGVENIGVQIEQPFSVLPLDNLCEGIERSVRDLAALSRGIPSFVDQLALETQLRLRELPPSAVEQTQARNSAPNGDSADLVEEQVVEIANTGQLGEAQVVELLRHRVSRTLSLSSPSEGIAALGEGHANTVSTAGDLEEGLAAR